MRTHIQNSPVVSTDAISSSSSDLGGVSLASLKAMAAQVVASASSHGVATSSTAGASGFPHIDSKQPETVDQTLRRKYGLIQVLCTRREKQASFHGDSQVGTLYM